MSNKDKEITTKGWVARDILGLKFFPREPVRKKKLWVPEGYGFEDEYFNLDSGSLLSVSAEDYEPTEVEVTIKIKER